MTILLNGYNVTWLHCYMEDGRETWVDNCGEQLKPDTLGCLWCDTKPPQDAEVAPQSVAPQVAPMTVGGGSHSAVPVSMTSVMFLSKLCHLYVLHKTSWRAGVVWIV